MPPPSDASTINTPLPPSVEKAYYRKCIELKRRLTEVESANDEAKIRRLRLDRGIMKLRLERAFLLDELRKRMEHNVDGSEGSGDEELVTPPIDRPHRDKRRRHLPPAPGPQPSASSHAHQPAPTPPVARVPSQPERGSSRSLGAREQDTNFANPPPHEAAPEQPYSAPAPPPVPSLPSQPLAQIPGSQQGAHADARQVNGSTLDGTNERDDEYGGAPTNREAGATGETLGVGPTVPEDANGDRKIVSTTSGVDAHMEAA